MRWKNKFGEEESYISVRFFPVALFVTIEVCSFFSLCCLPHHRTFLPTTVETIIPQNPIHYLDTKVNNIQPTQTLTLLSKPINQNAMFANGLIRERREILRNTHHVQRPGASSPAAQPQQQQQPVATSTFSSMFGFGFGFGSPAPTTSSVVPPDGAKAATR